MLEREKQSFKDIRVVIDFQNKIVDVINLSKIARERGLSIDEVVESFEGKGCKVLKLDEFLKLAQEAKSNILNS